MQQFLKLLFVIALLIIAGTTDSNAQPGQLDPTFNGTGKVTTDIGESADKAYAIAAQPDGKIIIAGTSMCQPVREGFALVRLNTDGTLDNTFGNNGITATLVANTDGVDDIIQAITLQPDGKILATGRSMGFYAKVVRYNSNGSIDTQFGVNGIATTPEISWAYGMALQTDGKILVTGESLDTVTSVRVFATVRLNADGTPDITFDNDGLVQTSLFGDTYYDNSRSVAVQQDGKIVVAGYTWDGTNNVYATVRYNIDGSIDNTFDTDGIVTTALGPYGNQSYALALQNDGKIIVGGNASTSNGVSEFAMVRYKNDGSIDSSFSDDGIDTLSIGPYEDEIYTLAVQNDGKIIAAGLSNDYYAPFTVVRFKSDGSINSTFNTDGILTIPFGTNNSYCYALAICPDGKIAMGGYTSSGPDAFHFAVARCTTDGTPDNTFSTDGKVDLTLALGSDKIYATAILPDGKIMTAGGSNGAGLTFARYNSDGNLDATFGNGGIKTTNFESYLSSMAIQDDGKMVIAMSLGFAIYRFKATGDIDSTFGTYGFTGANYFYNNYVNTGASAVAIQPDGKILVGGFTDDNMQYAHDFALARFKTNGDPDSTFGTNGKVATDLNVYGSDKIYALTLQPDGKIVAAGTSNGLFGVVRYNSNGSLDNSFGTNGMVSTLIGSQWNDEAKAVTVQPDGKIIVAGNTMTGTNPPVIQYSFALVKYLANGNIDNAFGTNGKAINDFGNPWNNVKSLALQLDGKILAGGSTGINDYSHIAQSDFALLRLNNDGSADNSFGTNGTVITDFTGGDDQANAMAFTNSGGILLAGYTTGSFDTDFALARYLPGIQPGVHEVTENAALLFNNPVSDFLTIKSDILKGFYKLYDITGKLILQSSINNQQSTIDVSTLGSGVYFISVSDGDRQVNGKVVKE